MGEPAAPVVHLVPMFAVDAMRVDALIFAGMLPWGAPTAIGASGIVSMEPAFLAGYEWPVPTGNLKVGKLGIEDLHIRRYFTDLAAAGVGARVGAIERGADPPDFIVRARKRAVGVECVQLALQQRRGAEALFRTLRDRVAERPQSNWRQLGRHVVYVWFGSEDSPNSLPHRRTDRAAIDSLVAALAEFRPAPITSTDPPAPIDPTGFGQNPNGGGFYAVPMEGAIPNTPFFSATGFELALGYTTSHRLTPSWDELRRLVREHDQRGVDTLLLTAGGPNAFGDSFIFESVMADFLIRHPQRLDKPTHIRDVVLHDWQRGRVVRLYPTLREVAAPWHGPLQPASAPM